MDAFSLQCEPASEIIISEIVNGVVEIKNGKKNSETGKKYDTEKIPFFEHQQIKIKNLNY